MILEIFKDSFEYSLKKPEILFKIGILSFLNSLIVPYFLIAGYSYRITKIGINGMINGNDPIPEFKDWITLFFEGIKITIVRFIYLLPGTLVFLIFSTSLVVSTIISADMHDMIEFPGYYVLYGELGIIAISIMLWLIFYLFSIVAIPNMINNKGSLKSAFKIKEIVAIIKSIGVFKYIQFYTGWIVLLLGIISFTILIITLIGLILGSILSTIIGSAALGFSGVFVSIILTIALIFIIYPFIMIFESRAIALMYNTRES